MTTARLCLYILLISSLEFLSNCVSVSLQKNELEPAKNVGYQIPLAPYEEIKLKSADKTWISKTTGNTLSFLSDCQKNSDPTLEQMLSDSVSVLDGLKISDNKELPYNGLMNLQKLQKPKAQTQALGSWAITSTKRRLLT